MPDIEPDLIASLLRAQPPAPVEALEHWWQGERSRRREWPGASAFEYAVRGGMAADRLGWALASGYQASLRAMIPSLPDDVPVAFCISEAEGNSPRAIRTSLVRTSTGWSLSGEKRWSTLGPAAGLLLVAARDDSGEASALRPLIRLVRVPANAPGLRFVPMPEADFIPEVPHARVQLEEVQLAADAVMPGDAYTQFVKPFRTIEDVLVTAAKLAWLLCEAARRSWPRPWRERALASLLALEALARRDPVASTSHIALAGALAGWHELLGEASEHFEAGLMDAGTERWQRDRRLFEIVFRARDLRVERAWERLLGEG